MLLCLFITLVATATVGQGLLDAEPIRISSSHCFSGSLQTDSWRTRACLVKNLCFNTSSKDFLFYSSSEQELPDVTSLGTFNYKWSSSYDKVVKFQPKLVVLAPGERIPGHATFTAPNELWFPFLPLAPSNIGHLIWDDYLPWFLFAKSAQELLGGNVRIRPLWVNPSRNADPPWATCDWIRLHEGPGHSLPADYSKRCLKNNAKWLHLILGAGETSVLETNNWGGNELVCFTNAALGLTAFANQGSGHHGWNPGDGVPPSFGRAPLLWAFREHMMRQANVSTTAPDGKELVILFSSKSSDRIRIDFTPIVQRMEKELDELNALVAPRARVVLKHQVLYELTAREQIELSSRVCVYLTAAGGGAFTAQFLPRGAALVLFEDNSAEHLHRGNVDWKFFNAASWMRTRFLNHKKARDVPLVSNIIRQEVLKCLSFVKF